LGEEEGQATWEGENWLVRGTKDLTLPPDLHDYVKGEGK